LIIKEAEHVIFAQIIFGKVKTFHLRLISLNSFFFSPNESFFAFTFCVRSNESICFVIKIIDFLDESGLFTEEKSVVSKNFGSHLDSFSFRLVLFFRHFDK
jgi:hypothetical protein